MQRFVPNEKETKLQQYKYTLVCYVTVFFSDGKIIVFNREHRAKAMLSDTYLVLTASEGTILVELWPITID